MNIKLKVEFHCLKNIRSRKNNKTYKLTYPPILPLIPELEEIELIKDNKDITLNKNISQRFNKKSNTSLDNFFS